MLAFVGYHHLHAGRFTHNASRGFEAARLHVGNQAVYANAADFFVVTEGQMQRTFEFSFEQLGHHHQSGSAVAFHVSHAAPVQLVANNLRVKRIRCPRLTINRHHIGVARQHQAAHFAFAVMCGQGGPQVGFFAGIVITQMALNALSLEQIARPFNDGQIAVARDRRKRDPFFNQRQGCQAGLKGS